MIDDEYEYEYEYEYEPVEIMTHEEILKHCIVVGVVKTTKRK